MLTPDQLDEYLDVLRDKGVTHFACEVFTVTLGLAPEEEEDDIGKAIQEAKEAEHAPRAARGVFGHPSLWNGGQPPRFPGSERANANHVPTHPDED